MKKKILNVLLSAAVITTMMLSATACGSKEPAADTSADVQPTTVQAADEQKADEPKADDQNADEQKADDGKMTLEEWTQSDECVQFLEAMNEGMGDQGVSIFFEVDGDVISMVYQYDEQIEVAEGAEETISALFESNSKLFEQVRDQLIEETGNENTVLKITYRNADDSEIFSMEF